MDITKACRDIKELNPLAQQACNLFLAECKKQGVAIFITETYRSQERQNYLYEQGRTRTGQIVTYTTKSNHTSRMAWDIACSPPQKLYDGSILKKAGEVASKLGIRWGGSCFGTFVDSPHFEILSTWKPPVAVVVAPKVASVQTPYIINKLNIQVCGELRNVDAINVNGNNFCKLRDVSFVGKITVEYVNGVVTVNGKQLVSNMINIAGFNYVKLQDLKTVGIKVEYDTIKKIPMLNV